MISPELPILNYIESARLRDHGMLAAANGYGAGDWLCRAREVAIYQAGNYGETTIDDVLRVCPRPASVSPAATGSVFKDKRFKCVGITESAQVQRHAGIIRRWSIA